VPSFIFIKSKLGLSTIQIPVGRLLRPSIYFCSVTVYSFRSLTNPDNIAKVSGAAHAPIATVTPLARSFKSRWSARQSIIVNKIRAGSDQPFINAYTIGLCMSAYIIMCATFRDSKKPDTHIHSVRANWKRWTVRIFCRLPLWVRQRSHEFRLYAIKKFFSWNLVWNCSESVSFLATFQSITCSNNVYKWMFYYATADKKHWSKPIYHILVLLNFIQHGVNTRLSCNVSG
jgi:hypothetical protein